MKNSLHSTAVLLTAILALLAACETMKGFGEDVSKGGDDISNSAEKHTP